MRKLLPAALLAVCVLGVAQPAIAAPSPKASPATPADVPASARVGVTPVGAEEGGITDTLMDTNGRVISRTEKHQVRQANQPPERNGDANADGGKPKALAARKLLDDGGYSGTGTGGVSTGSGCRSIDIYKSVYTAFGFLAYRYHVVKGWCWGWTSVLNPYQYDYVSNIDTNFIVNGIVGTSDYYYWWLYFNGNSGHATFRQRSISNCILKYGCLSTLYPWVSLHAHGDGTYQWSRGQ